LGGVGKEGRGEGGPLNPFSRLDWKESEKKDANPSSKIDIFRECPGM
jgi:hypothetical protein